MKPPLLKGVNGVGFECEGGTGGIGIFKRWISSLASLVLVETESASSLLSEVTEQLEESKGEEGSEKSGYNDISGVPG